MGYRFPLPALLGTLAIWPRWTYMWLVAGEVVLTVLFLYFTIVFALATFLP